MKLSTEQIKSFTAAFPIEEIRQYAKDHREEYLQFLAEEAQREQERQNTPSPIRRRISRKGVM
jgi:uncharacterized damage-inducible protein DinB